MVDRQNTSPDLELLVYNHLEWSSNVWFGLLGWLLGSFFNCICDIVAAYFCCCSPRLDAKRSRLEKIDFTNLSGLKTFYQLVATHWLRVRIVFLKMKSNIFQIGRLRDEILLQLALMSPSTFQILRKNTDNIFSCQYRFWCRILQAENYQTRTH